MYNGSTGDPGSAKNIKAGLMTQRPQIPTLEGHRESKKPYLGQPHPPLLLSTSSIR